jgi:predicted RNase H-like HicB family nuclease
MTSELFFLIEEDLEGGYNAKAIGTKIFTQGDTLSELKNNIRDAVLCHFDDADMPKVIRLHFVKDEIMAL